MKNVTITLDEDVALWARIRAAKGNTSVSRLVGDMLRNKMLDEETYLLSMQQYLSQRPRKLKKSGAGYPSRTQLHER
jgi:plasmid stability protein